MPRGVRAVHGAEVQGDHHGHGAALATHYSPDTEWLLVQCWCEEFVVLVPQKTLRRYGETQSCGRVQCVGPDGQDEITLAIYDFGDGALKGKWSQILGPKKEGLTIPYDRVMAWVDQPPEGHAEAMRARIERAIARATKPLDVTKKKPHARKYPKRQGKRGRRIDFYVALRREKVRELYVAGKTIRQIALACDVTDKCVGADISWLRARGLVGYRNNVPGARRNRSREQDRIPMEYEAWWTT